MTDSVDYLLAAGEFAGALCLSLLAVVYLQPFPAVAAFSFLASIGAYSAGVAMVSHRRRQGHVHDDSGCGNFE